MSLLAAVPVFATYGGVLPMLHTRAFYVGVASLNVSVFEQIYQSISVSPRVGLFGTHAAAKILTYFYLPAVMAFIALASLVMIGAHYLVDLNYPIDRTGLWLMLLFGMVWALAAGNTSNRLARTVNLVLAVALAFQFATQFHADFFPVWRYDRSIKEIAHRIEAEIRGKPPAPSPSAPPGFINPRSNTTAFTIRWRRCSRWRGVPLPK